MSEEQVIRDPSDLRKYRTELPNLVDDSGLDVYEFRLLAHYKRVGTCTESLETTAAKCKLSEGKASEARQSLADKGWINLERVTMDAGRYRYIVTVKDRWVENFAKYSGLSEAEIAEQVNRASASPREGSPSPHEASPSPREVKNKPIKKLKDSLSSDDFAKMSVREAMRVPTLNLYFRATGFFPSSAVWAIVDAFLKEHPLTHEQINCAYAAWMMRGYRQENIEGILDWALNGVPAKGAKHANSNARNQKSAKQSRPAKYTDADRAAADAINAQMP